MCPSSPEFEVGRVNGSAGVAPLSRPTRGGMLTDAFLEREDRLAPYSTLVRQNITKNPRNRRDIPYEHLQNHVAKYGRFGLSVDKKYAIGFGTRPVTYFPYWGGGHLSAYGPTLLKDIDATYRGFVEHIAAPLMDGERPWRKLTRVPNSPEQAADAVHAAFLKDFLAFLKPFNADLPEDHPDYFYAEKEWRRLGNLKVENQHVRRVVLAKGFEQRLADAVPGYTFKTDVALSPS